MKKSFDTYIENFLFLIVSPFFWIKEKWEYYTKERDILKNEINHCHASIHSLEQELDNCLAKARSDREYFQSENDRLRRILSAKGYSSKKLKNFQL